MIGPHEGKELELMLAGKKNLAMFHDILSSDGIPEDIIPEQAFAPYVQEGRLIRSSRDIETRSNDVVRIVCFTTPDNVWRADFIFWIKETLYKQPSKENYDAEDTIIGRLLGYSENDIADFLQHQKEFLIAA